MKYECAHDHVSPAQHEKCTPIPMEHRIGRLWPSSTVAEVSGARNDYDDTEG